MKTPTMGDIYQFMDGTLTDGRHREIAHWMVRCVDPKLPGLLDYVLDKIKEGMSLEEFEQHIKEELERESQAQEKSRPAV